MSAHVQKRWRIIQRATIGVFLLLMASLAYFQPGDLPGFGNLSLFGFYSMSIMTFLQIISRFWGSHGPLAHGGRWLRITRSMVDGITLGLVMGIWSIAVVWVAYRAMWRIDLLHKTSQWIVFPSIGLGAVLGFWLSWTMQRRLTRYAEAMAFALACALNLFLAIGLSMVLVKIEMGMSREVIRVWGPPKIMAGMLVWSSLITLVGMLIYLAAYRKQYQEELRARNREELTPDDGRDGH